MKIKQPDDFLKGRTWYDRGAETTVVREQDAIDMGYDFADQFIPEWIPIDWDKLPSGEMFCAIIENKKIKNIFIDDIEHSVKYWKELSYTHYFPVKKIQIPEYEESRERTQARG